MPVPSFYITLASSIFAINILICPIDENNVLLFVRNPQEPDMWSNDYFVQRADLVQVIVPCRNDDSAKQVWEEIREEMKEIPCTSVSEVQEIQSFYLYGMTASCQRYGTRSRLKIRRLSFDGYATRRDIGSTDTEECTGTGGFAGSTVLARIYIVPVALGITSTGQGFGCTGILCVLRI